MEVFAKIRDFTIVAGIYLYFIAWVYIHFYYAQFGLSSSTIKIDYSSYLAYSYRVLTSGQMFRLVPMPGIILVGWLLIQWFKRYSVLTRFTNALLSLLHTYSIWWVCVLLAFLFPLLFSVAKNTAVDDYNSDRYIPQNLKTILFLFKKETPYLNVSGDTDTLKQANPFADDIKTIKNDNQQALRLLGENDDYYIVLNQPPYDEEYKAYPRGSVYFIDKKEVLLSKVILHTQEINLKK